jgi:hypothetical protein
VHVEHHIEAEEAQMFPFLEAGWQASLAHGRTGGAAARVWPPQCHTGLPERNSYTSRATAPGGSYALRA